MTISRCSWIVFPRHRPSRGNGRQDDLHHRRPQRRGKATFAQEFLPNEASCPAFTNADLIAAGLSPFAPELAAFKAGRLMLEAMAEHAEQGENFAFETTLAGRFYAQRIPIGRRSAITSPLIFQALPSPEMAIARVAERVRQGGHAVPDEVVRRRFTAGMRNFAQVYRDRVDAWAIHDNSGAEAVLLDWSEKL